METCKKQIFEKDKIILVKENIVKRLIDKPDSSLKSHLVFEKMGKLR